MRQSSLFCYQTPEGYRHFYASAKIVGLCVMDCPIVEVTVTELPAPVEGCYWAWWDVKDQDFSMIYHAQALVEMCFPYGSKVEEDRGKGKVCPVTISQAKP